MMKSRLFSLLPIIALFFSACSTAERADTVISTSGKIPLTVYAAGSLIVPFGEVETAFERLYPYIDVRPEYHGSIQVIRQAMDLQEQIDVFATADASLIPMLMYLDSPETGSPYADWYIRFATNRMALAYNPTSKYAGEITGSNWSEILTRPDVKVGLSDPRLDALGYRALMAFILQDNLLGGDSYFNLMFKDQFTNPLTVIREQGLSTITVPEILETKSGVHIVLRGASVQLIALLESGEIDYAFGYESVLRQHNLTMLELPPEVDLGEEGFEEIYNQVLVELNSQHFTTVKPIFIGERIGYGITIPENAPHPDEAALFIAFLLGAEGRSIMETNYHPIYSPPVADRYDNLPAGLQSITVPLDMP